MMVSLKLYLSCAVALPARIPFPTLIEYYYIWTGESKFLEYEEQVCETGT